MDRKLVPWVVVLVLLLGLGFLGSLYSGALRDKRIARSNEKVALDTTRISLVGELQAASHLVEQKEIKVDQLQGALAASLKDRQADARVIQGYLVTINKLHRLLQTPSSETTDSSGTRTATFKQEGPPIVGEQIVTAPPAPKPILLESHLGVTPFNVRYGLGCAKDHTPAATFETPTWVQTTFEKGQVDPAICNPKVPFWSLNFGPDLKSILYGVGGYLLKTLISK